jgi:hypothetical protein
MPDKDMALLFTHALTCAEAGSWMVAGTILLT